LLLAFKLRIDTYSFLSLLVHDLADQADFQASPMKPEIANSHADPDFSNLAKKIVMLDRVKRTDTAEKEMNLIVAERCSLTVFL